MPSTTVIRPDSAFLTAVASRSGQPISLCYQCRKCTNGCPLTFAMDIMPNQVVRMIELGMRDELLRSKTIWVCASCQTCSTRCPNDIDIAHLMDSLRQLSRESGNVAEPKILKFHEAFLASIRCHGRTFELGMVARYKLSTLDLFSDLSVSLGMFKRGKIGFFPDRIKGRRAVRRMFGKRGGGAR